MSWDPWTRAARKKATIILVLEEQAWKRPGAAAELLGLDAQAVQHAQIEIAQGRWTGRIEREVLPVLEAAAREQHRQIPGRVVARVSQVAAEEDHGAVEQRRVLLRGLLQLREQVPDALHLLELHLL